MYLSENLTERGWFNTEPIRRRLLEGFFPEFEEEIQGIMASPTACRGRSYNAVKMSCLDGKTAEIALRFYDRNWMNLDRNSFLTYGKDHPHFDKVLANIKYHDTLNYLEGLIAEVKAWRVGYENNFNSPIGRAFISKLKAKSCMWPDKVIVFSLNNGSTQMKFHKCWDTAELIARHG